jgi:hypothetical protein
LKTEDLTADRRQQGPPMVPSAKQTGRAAGLIPAAVQRDPKTGQRLVSKDIGGQRWAITYDETGGSAIGNVYNQDGSPPQFVYCERNGDDGSRDVNDLVLYFDCRVASSCRSDGSGGTL